MKPGARRWGIALVLLVAAQLAAYAWGEAVRASPPADLVFDRPPKSLVQTAAFLVSLVGNLWCLARLLPAGARSGRFSFASLLGSVAVLPLLASAVLGARGLVFGVNDLLPREPDERRVGVVAGYLQATPPFELAVVRLGERDTLEVPLRQDVAKTLPPESPVALEFHHGVLFTWGRVHRLGPPARPPPPKWTLPPP